jgi:hypothetical protein
MLSGAIVLAGPMARFVVLQHQLRDPERAGTHWDFMLEHDGVLWTWALDESPETERDITANRLADHRLAYLDYEGAVSGNRGSVTQWDAGEFEFTKNNSANDVSVRLKGRRLNGTARLRENSGGDQRWIFKFST